MENYAVRNSRFLCQRQHEEMKETGLCARTDFQRDRDRILHSRAFRRMMHKTQVFNANMGDHYRNRLTHTLEVSQIARSIGKALGLDDELIEAIALGHDLGHTPFGHTGERVLNDILMHGVLEGISPIDEGFKHNFQSVRIMDCLESRCEEYNGLNLTLAVREGVLKHTKTRKQGEVYKYTGMDLCGIALDTPSFTLEGQVVGIADEIAQCTHDLEDGVRSGILSMEFIRKDPLVAEILKQHRIKMPRVSECPTYDVRTLVIKHMVGHFITDVCEQSFECVKQYINKYQPDYSGEGHCINEQCIKLSPELEENRKRISTEVKERVICSQSVSASDSKSDYIIKQLFKAYYEHPRQLPDYILKKYCANNNMPFNRKSIDADKLQNDPNFKRTICDHIAGMTDQYAAREYFELYIPEYI